MTHQLDGPPKASAPARFTLPEDAIDPLFRLPAGNSLSLPRAECTELVAEWHTHQITRKPGDLMAHVRRIFLQNELGHDDELSAALADLFIVLGSKGQTLKRRLLRTYWSALPETAANYLSMHVENGLTPAVCVPWNAVLALGLGHCGRPPFATPTPIPQPPA